MARKPPPHPEFAACARALVAWYHAAQRALPWRTQVSAYGVWVSEIMLQQTRVATVIPYWQRWMRAFPTIEALAQAPLDEVLAHWAGLGYYTRARNLHAGAAYVCHSLARRMPTTASELRQIPGIGPYTAGAIASIAFAERTPLVDGNVVRVLARVFAVSENAKSTPALRRFWALAQALVEALPAAHHPGELNQALMELGALLCTPTSPQCQRCPLAAHGCLALAQGRVADLPVLPKRKRAAELPVVQLATVWMPQPDGTVLAAKRPNPGLFAGLWELPSLAYDGPAPPWPPGLARLASATPVAHHEQVLSHRRLRVSVYAWKNATLALGKRWFPGYEEWTRVTPAALRELGIAKSTASLLATLEDPSCTPTPPPKRSSPKATKKSSKA